MVVSRNKEQTKETFLRIGRDLLISRGVPLSLHNVTVVEVAQLAGRTPGAAYNLWPTQQDFHRELAITLAMETEWGDPTTMAGPINEVLLRNGTMAEVIRAACNAYLNDVTAQRAYSTFVFFRSIALNDPEIHGAIKAAYDRFHEIFRELYASLLLIFDRELIPPFTINHFTVSMTSLTEGFLLRRGIDPERVPLRMENPEATGTADDWSLYALTTERFVMSVTRARRPADDDVQLPAKKRAARITKAKQATKAST